jgi:AraC-like DNA-binding protein
MSTLLLVKLAAQHGIPEEKVLAGTGLTAADLRVPDAEVRTHQELAAISNLLGAAKSPTTLGLEAGLRYHLTTYGIWGYAMVSASTFRESIDVGLRYLDLTYTFAPIVAEDDGDDLHLVLEEDPDIPAEITRFLVQREAAAIHTLQREVLGWPAHPRSVTFRHTATATAIKAYTEIFGSAPTFGADRNVVVLDAKQLDAPLPQADLHTNAMAQQMCADILDSRTSRVGLAGRVRDLIVGSLRNPPSLGDAAQALHMSPRTLRRRLSLEGTTLRQLIDEVRATLSAELIAGGRLTVAEVSRRLGYVEASSFSQAFRRWHGVSPRAYQSGADQSRDAD